MAYNPEHVLKLARAIRPHLEKLLQKEFRAIDKKLSDLLKRAETGENVANSILDVLSNYEATREWMRRFLETAIPKERERFYGAPAPAPPQPAKPTARKKAVREPLASTRKPEARYVNVCFTTTGKRSVVPKNSNLRPSTRYKLRVDIGPWSPDSAVQNAAGNPFPSERLPPSRTGYWLQVVVASEDFVIEKRRHDLYLPESAPSWVCRCTPGEDHQCRQAARKQYLFIPLMSPPIVSESIGAGRASQRAGRASISAQITGKLRLAVYYKNNVVQSQILTASVALSSKGGAYSSWIDYTLTESLTDLDSFSFRTLNLLTNQNTDGSHKILINGNIDDAIAFDLGETQARDGIEAARQTLRNIHVEEYGGDLGAKRQIRNRYDEHNAKPKTAFLADLKALASVGKLLWDAITRNDMDVSRRLRKLLTEPGFIQICRISGSNFVFPWSLVYDIGLGSDSGDYVICKLLETWDGKQPYAQLSSNRCPYEKGHTKNTVCPFGFWGFRHTIEQPPSTGNRKLCVNIAITRPKPELVIGVSLDLDQKLTKAHLDAIQSRLIQFAVIPEDSKDGFSRALSGPKLELVYLYCHGRRVEIPNTRITIPYLEIGQKQGIAPQDITTWAEYDWSEDHWHQTAPLVILNGCHTAELTPELLVNFVDAFIGVHAAGVIGTEIMLHQQLASEAAEEFLSNLQACQSVNQALQQMRLHFLLKGNLMGLAYTPYCSANLELSH